MPRIRTIKPDFWTDGKIGTLKRDERLLFIGLWNLADDQGVLKSNSAYIKGQLFSYDEDLRISSVETWLASLTKAQLLIPFLHKEEGYYLIRTFSDHQIINRPSKKKFTDKFLTELKNTHGALTEPSSQEGKGMEGNKEGRGTPDPPHKSVCYDVEQDLQSNRIQFEKICMASGVTEEIGLQELRKFHLWMTKNEKYPTGKIAAYAGFESWLLNRDSFKKEIKNGSSQTQKSGSSNRKSAGAEALVADLKADLDFINRRDESA